jgi:hypothetical protein
VAKRYQDRGATGVLGNDIVGILSRLGVQPEDLQTRIVEGAQSVATFLGTGLTSLVTGLFSAFFIFIFTAITSYYLLRGSDAASWLVEVVPLPNWEVALIVRNVRDVTRAMLFSTAVMTIYQGVTAGIGYWIFGGQPAGVGRAHRHRLHHAGGGHGHHLGAGDGVPHGDGTRRTGAGRPGVEPRLRRRLHPAAQAGRHADQDERPAGLHRHLARHRGLRRARHRAGAVAVAVFLALIRIYQREYRPEGPVRAHDITAAERPMHQ